MSCEQSRDQLAFQPLRVAGNEIQYRKKTCCNGPIVTANCPVSFLTMSKSRHQLLLIVYLGFVIYGSLVPLAFHPLAFDVAWERFLDIPWLSLGAISRADWIANIILYIPLSLLLISRLSRSGSRTTGLNIAITLLICLMLAICIEFAQVYFPPRTVSLNDLLAEFLGTAMGIASWLIFGRRMRRWGNRVARGDRSAFESLLWAYLLFYLLVSLFPFDFVVSMHELQAKLRSGTVGLVFASSGCGAVLICAAKFIIEALLTVPIGLLLAGRMRGQGGSCFLPFLVGMVLGLSVEAVQMLIISGVSQGFSAIPKSLGVVAGYVLYANSGALKAMIARFKPGSLVVGLSVPYLIGLLVANDWFRADWVTSAEAAEDLSQVHFLPFYYHYYTTETVAMASLLFNAFLYSPIGFAFAFIQKAARKRSYVLTAIVAASLAFLIEGARLFQSGEHADPTNIIIALGSAMLAQLIAAQVLSLDVGAAQSLDRKPEVGGSTQPSRRAVDPGALFRGTPSWRAAMGLVLISVAAISLYTMPFAKPFLMVAGAVLLLLQFLFPLAWLYVLPIIVTVLDLAPWSGWFFWDEADALLLLMVGGLLFTHAPSRLFTSKGSRVIVVLLLASWGGAALMPVLPVPAIDMNSFNNYFSSFNALRVGKGFFWALIFMPFLAIVASDKDARSALMRGVLVGAGLLAGWVIVERQWFSGILDLSNDFRVTASFSTLR